MFTTLSESPALTDPVAVPVAFAVISSRRNASGASGLSVVSTSERTPKRLKAPPFLVRIHKISMPPVGMASGR